MPNEFPAGKFCTSVRRMSIDIKFNTFSLQVHRVPSALGNPKQSVQSAHPVCITHHRRLSFIINIT